MFEELIAAAQRRLDDADKNGTAYDCQYWGGYIDGLKAAQKKAGQPWEVPQ